MESVVDAVAPSVTFDAGGEYLSIRGVNIDTYVQYCIFEDLNSYGDPGAEARSQAVPNSTQSTGSASLHEQGQDSGIEDGKVSLHADDNTTEDGTASLQDDDARLL